MLGSADRPVRVYRHLDLAARGAVIFPQIREDYFSDLQCEPGIQRSSDRSNAYGDPPSDFAILAP